MMKPMMCSPYAAATMKTHKMWMVSEKLDGWRMFYIGGKFYLRSGKEVIPSETIVEEMKRVDPEERMMLDGELWLGYGRFDQIGSALEARDEALIWKVFDMPSAMGGFHTRYVTMLKTLTGCQKIQVIDQEIVMNAEGADRVFEETMKDEMKEGIVLRFFDMEYMWDARPVDFMKRKRIQDMEVQVARYHVTDTAKRQKVLDPDYVSSLECATLTGELFRVSVRTNRPPPIGSVITVKYQNLTERGVPRFPVYKSVRDEKDRDVPVAGASVPNADVDAITLEELEAMKGNVALGQKIYVRASKMNEYYTVTIPVKEGMLPYCSCPAWKYQRISPAARKCKHTCVLL